MPAKPRFVSKPIGEVEGEPKCKLFDPAILALKAAEAELECLKLEEAMYEELLAQEQLKWNCVKFSKRKSPCSIAPSLLPVMWHPVPY